ncbi:NAD(P)/FAD-dependent oxidoreductase [Brevibacterium yomogidense]|uniref:NAD(P)/FAD-dependent oxidoreductase n=1 Tax=Brevibacterium yomogidense TaxID=946573 RepID=UPI0018DF6E22|nr:FAD-dependent oxidoreductase [Brevibacterium yomogidense]
MDTGTTHHSPAGAQRTGESARRTGGRARQVDRRHVAVIGGGVIGLASAYRLAQAGLDVTVLERDAIGQGASWGNAGWIVPTLVQPFNAPGVATDAVKTFFKRDGYAALSQVPTPRLALWGLSFLRHSSAARSDRSLRALAAMAHDTAEATGTLAEELGFEIHRTGLLIPFASQEGLDQQAVTQTQLEELGYKGRTEWLDTGQLAAREPSLSSGLAGGLHLLDELTVRPDSMTAGLARGFVAAGGELREQTRVSGLHAEAGGHWKVRTASGADLLVDAVVVAAGEHSDVLLRRAGARVLLQSGRGCSVTLPGTISLNQAVKLAEVMVACSPFDNGKVRISGTFDLVGRDASTNRARMQHVLDAATPYLPGLADVDLETTEVWSGPRPATPDSVPVVGPVGKKPGLYAATGHGTLGMTLAAGTAATIAMHVGRLMRSRGVRVG